MYIHLYIYISFYTSLYVYTRVYTYESTCSAPRHGAYPGPRRARVRASPTSRRPLVEGAHGTARPQPRRRRGRRREDTRRRPANDSRGAGGQRASAARPPPDHEPKHHPQEAESDRGGTPVRFSNFRSFFLTFVLSCLPRARAPRRSPRRVSLYVCFCYRFSILCLAKRRFRRPFDLCVIACVRFCALGVHRLAPDSVHPSYVCVCRDNISTEKPKSVVIVLRSNTDIWSWAGGSSKRQDESSERGLSLNRSQRGNCSTEYNTPLGT